MNHARFYFLSLATALLSTGVIVLYNWFFLVEKEEILFLKIFPSILMLVLTVSYFIIYRITVYTLLTSTFLIFCLTGDVFMGMYHKGGDFPPLLVGGIFFASSRIIFGVNMMTFKNCQIIKYKALSLLVSHLIFNLFSLGLILTFYFLTNPPISYLLMAYIGIGFGFEASYAYLRIGQIKNENSLSSIISFIGFILFNLSDTLLFLTLFTNHFPKYCILISDDLYWIGIFCITLSIVRFENSSLEKEEVV